jgi:hypothetical protein
MGAPAVVDPDPVADHAHRVLLALEAMPVNALLLDRSDQRARPGRSAAGNAA